MLSRCDDDNVEDDDGLLSLPLVVAEAAKFRCKGRSIFRMLDGSDAARVG